MKKETAKNKTVEIIHNGKVKKVKKFSKKGIIYPATGSEVKDKK